jgi:hypothetical protein
MIGFNPEWFREDGRLRGCHVYLLLCRDDGPIYAKVGISGSPGKRMMALRLGCPVKPRQFHSFEVRSRKKALLVERAIHLGLDRWKAHGEWFRVGMEEKPDFNSALTAAIDPHRETGWPCVWERVPVEPVVEHVRKGMRFRQKLWARSGNSYKDFKRQSMSE